MYFYAYSANIKFLWSFYSILYAMYFYVYYADKIETSDTSDSMYYFRY